MTAQTRELKLKHIYRGTADLTHSLFLSLPLILPLTPSLSPCYRLLYRSLQRSAPLKVTHLMRCHTQASFFPPLLSQFLLILTRRRKEKKSVASKSGWNDFSSLEFYSAVPTCEPHHNFTSSHCCKHYKNGVSLNLFSMTLADFCVDEKGQVGRAAAFVSARV